MRIQATEVEVSPYYIWYPPDPHEEYVIGVDVAEGKASSDIHDPTGEHRDWSVASVLQGKDGALVAQYKSQVDTASLAVDLYMLGYWYNQALLAVETNSMGIGVVHMLEKANYPNLYQPKRPTPFQVGIGNFMEVKSMGWVTTRATKPILIAAIHEALADRKPIYSKSLLYQLQTIQMDNNGRIGAPPGSHDDEVMSYGIALVVWGEALKSRGTLKAKKTLKDEDAWVWRVSRETEEARMAMIEEEEDDGWF